MLNRIRRRLCQPGQDVSVTAKGGDLRELQGHNLDVRAPMQRWLADNRERISQVTVLVRKAATIVKMAASVVALATRMNIEIRDESGGDSAARRIGR